MDKPSAMAKLVATRKLSRWPGYRALADYADLECDFVSPYTRGAGNLESPILVMLQDWVSHDYLAGGISPDVRRIGYNPQVRTNRNLQERLQHHFSRSIGEVYATNLFPFIKPGGMSARIPWRDLERAAKEFALPQIEIVQPRLVIALGLQTFQALRKAATGSAGPGRLGEAIACPFSHGVSRFWCQAHTGWGCSKRGRVGTDNDWNTMAEWFVRG